MPNLSRRADVLAAMPGTEDDITKRAGVAPMTTNRQVKRLHADGLCHIAGWHRPAKGVLAAVYAAGSGRDAERDLEPFSEAEVSKRYRTRKREREAARLERLAAPFAALAWTPKRVY